MKIKAEIAFAITLTLLLLVLCVDKFMDLKAQARQGLNEKALIALNDALSVYRGDNEGFCPKILEELEPFYIEKIPPLYDDKGEISFAVKNSNTAEISDKTTAWVYVNNEKSPDYCKVFINNR